ncbi:hypothetical protein [Streptodolium elevatio]|uniref:Uncharacterized protein n=1 Tax=Streptodolium elevatio TaxID=3157996 RepID=A0ABV3DAS2_9ACTN
MNVLYFSVPLARLPHDARYQDAPPGDLGIGILVSDDEIEVAPAATPTRMVEVTDRRQVEDWIEQNGGGPPAEQDARVEPFPADGERRFAFLVPACATPDSTRVEIGPDGLPVLVADTSRPYHAEPCAPREHYLVVYDVPAAALPPPAAIAPVASG